MFRSLLSRTTTTGIEALPTVALQRGFGLLETLAALAVASAAAAIAVQGTLTLVGAARLESARATLVFALLDARRSAYERETTVELRLPLAATEAIVAAADAPAFGVALAAGTYVAATSRRAGVRFYASGLADNSTFVIASSAYDGKAEIVVNQRGGVR